MSPSPTERSSRARAATPLASPEAAHGVVPRRPRRPGHPLLWRGLPAMSMVVLVLAAAFSEVLAPRGALPAVALLLAASIVGALAALHRPWRAETLGLGAVVLVPLADALGVVPASLVSMVVLVAGSALHHAVRDPMAKAEARFQAAGQGIVSALAGLAPVLGAVFLTLVVRRLWIAETSAAIEVLVPVLIYAVLLTVLRWLDARWRATWWPADGTTLQTDVASLLQPLPFDALGWLAGALAASVARDADWWRVAPLVVVVALLSVEAARNAALRGASDQRLGSLERLQEAHVRILAESSEAGEIAQQILVECRNVLPVQWFQLEVLPPPEGAPGDPQAARQSWCAGPNGVLTDGVPRPSDRPRALPGVHRRAEWKVIEHPLEAEGEVLATVRLWCDPRQIQPGSEKLLASLVPQMASSVHRARLDREAKLDPLTGVPVRRILERGLQRAYRDCCDEGFSMAVILCDIDHFKKVNDTYGHDAGDQALVVFARTLDEHKRDGDLCCRYGGEEFTLLLERTDGRSALRLAERLRRAVEGIDFVYDGQPIRLTMSAGVAAFPELHVKTAGELQLLADEALYQAKEQGRNRVLLNQGRGHYLGIAGDAPTEDDPGRERSLPRIFH